MEVPSPTISNPSLEPKQKCQKLILKCAYEKFGETLDSQRFRIFQAFMEIDHPRIPGEGFPVRFGVVWRKSYRDGVTGSDVNRPIILTICFPNTEKYYGWENPQVLRHINYGHFLFQLNFLDGQGNSVIGEEFSLHAGHGSCLRFSDSNTSHLDCINSTYFHSDFLSAKSNPSILPEFKNRCIQLKPFSKTHQLYFVEAHVQVTPLPPVRVQVERHIIDFSNESNLKFQFDNDEDYLNNNNSISVYKNRFNPLNLIKAPRLHYQPAASNSNSTSTTNTEAEQQRPEPELDVQFGMKKDDASDSNDSIMMDVDPDNSGDEPVWDPSIPVAASNTRASLQKSSSTHEILQAFELMNLIQNQENLNYNKPQRKRRQMKLILKKPEKSPRRILEAISEEDQVPRRMETEEVQDQHQQVIQVHNNNGNLTTTNAKAGGDGSFQILKMDEATETACWDGITKM